MSNSPAAPEFLAGLQHHVEAALTGFLNHAPQSEPLTDAPLQTAWHCSEYAIAGGGKRIRPVLVYLAAEAVAGNIEFAVLDHPACAVEMIHSYSLVHDDLPAMDDDDFRRGRPSCHKAFDEALAILAGDALQSLAFEILADTPRLDASDRLTMVRVLARAIGLQGMVGGQAIDIGVTDSTLTLSGLQRMHSLKTGALINASVSLGAIAGRATLEQRKLLDTFSRHIGLAFQIVDDILDVTSNRETLGKTPGKDNAGNKPTYVSLLGLEAARRESEVLLQAALEALEPLGEHADRLRELARYIIERAH